MCKGKNITLILPSYKSGGAEKMMIHLANGFAEMGLRTTVIIFRPIGPFKSLVSEKVRLIEGAKLPSIYLYIPWLIFLFISLKPEKILSSQSHINVVTFLSAIFSFRKSKVVFRETNPPSVSTVKKISIKSITSIFAKLIYPMVNKHIAISKAVKKDMVNYYNLDPKCVRVIYSPVISNDITYKSNVTLNHTWFNANTPVFITVGRISPVKDYITMINAFHIVRSKMKCRLVIIGAINKNQVYFQEILQLAEYLNVKEDIEFLGYSNNPYRYMANADLFILASKWEGFGNVLVEALYCGCPVVSTDCPGGPREILDNGKYGTLVPVGDENKMAAAILDTLKSKTEKNLLVKRGNEFTQEKSVNKYLKYIYE